MFGMGMGELLLILVVALLVVGPDKLPQAAKAIGRGIRDFRRHSQELQTTLEQDEKLGEAVRELRSALRDDPLRFRPGQRTPMTPKAAPKPGSGPGADSASAAASAAASTAASEPGTPSTSEGAAPDAPPSVVPAAGAVAKQAPGAAREGSRPIDARPDPRPGTTRSSEADDPAHG